MKSSLTNTINKEVDMKLLYYPNEHLKQRCDEAPVGDEFFVGLANRMLDFMYRYNGIGLAANQIGMPYRIIVMDTNYSYGEKTPYIFINPSIVSLSKETDLCIEGCLSVPGIQEKVKRHLSLDLEYYDENWNRVQNHFTDIEAQCIQHELEHLDGKIFLDNLGARKAMAVSKYFKSRNNKRR